MTVPQAFEVALQHHQAGRLAEAEALYRQILAAQPIHADALHLLGVVAHQTGRSRLAADLIRQSLIFDPHQSTTYSNLGEVYRSLGLQDEAVVCYRDALALKPDNFQAQNNLGIALAAIGRLGEAIVAYDHAIELNPGIPEIHNNLGNALRSQGHFEEAIAAYRRAVALNPGYREAHNNLGNTLAERNQPDEAMASLRRALDLNPNEASAHYNLAVALAGHKRIEEAKATYRWAIKLEPAFAEAHYNLGLLLVEEHLLEEAGDCFHHALEIKPDFAGATYALALLLSLRGEFEHGFRLYEARWEARGFRRRSFFQPIWDGGPIEGRRVLVHAEQGIGDTIQFIRYAPHIAARGGEVVVECQRPLVDLLRTVSGVQEVVAAGDLLPSFHLHIPMLSQPFVFQTKRESVPRHVPYLFTDPERQETWKTRIGADQTRLRVGLAWAGNSHVVAHRKRHIPPERLLPLLRLTGVAFYSLQVAEQADQLRQSPDVEGILDYTNHLGDFTDTAAFMMELDLIISVDTAVAHLAGTLGRPAWTLLAFVPDWRWGLEGDETPWYPTMRLFRQPALSDWDSVIQRVADELRLLVKSRNP